VVDDSRFSRRIISLLLESSGAFEVVAQAMDGEEGLARVREFRPDVVTLDVDMPRLDGISMLRTLRRESDVPVVLVTALPNSEELNALIGDLGAVEMVVKTYSNSPLDLSVFGDELIAKVHAAVRRKTPCM
jgi:two-component system chemotaxis response regulator CheB